MHVMLESLGDPVWQIGGAIVLLGALILVVAVRSPEMPLSTQRRELLTRLTGLLCCALLLVLTGGVVLLHAVNASSTAGSEATLNNTATAVPSVTSSPQPLSAVSPITVPSPSPTPFPRLVPGPGQVLSTFCEAVNRQDVQTAWGAYDRALQKERVDPPPFVVRITIVHCSVNEVSDTPATGLLLLKTIGPNGYTDDYERPYQFTLGVESGAWKIIQIARCLSDGCLDETGDVVA